jgi:hypothetical protein
MAVPGGDAPADSALTDAGGVALLRPLLDTRSGEQVVTAYVFGTETRVRVNAYALAGTPVLALLNPVTVGRTLRTFHVRVTSQSGTPLAGYPVHVLTGGSQYTMTRTNQEGVVSSTAVFRNPGGTQTLVQAGAARLELNGAFQNSFIEANVFPNAEVTPATQFLIATSINQTNPLSGGGVGRFAPRDAGGTWMTGTVHGRTTSLYEIASFDGEFLWAPYPGWLDGLPDGPTVIRIEMGARFGTSYYPAHSRWDLPIVLRQAP